MRRYIPLLNPRVNTSISFRLCSTRITKERTTAINRQKWELMKKTTGRHPERSRRAFGKHVVPQLMMRSKGPRTLKKLKMQGTLMHLHFSIYQQTTCAQCAYSCGVHSEWNMVKVMSVRGIEDAKTQPLLSSQILRNPKWKRLETCLFEA